MKKQVLFLVAFCTLLATANAQNEPKRELGIRFDGVDLGGGNAFSMVYKKPKSDTKYFRWRATYGNVFFNAAENTSNNFSIGLGANFGIEKRKPLSEKFAFCHGPEFGVNTYINDTFAGVNVGVGGRAGYILGLQFNPGKHFFLNFETIPGVGINVTSSDDVDQVTVNGGFAFSSAAALTLGVRF